MTKCAIDNRWCVKYAIFKRRVINEREGVPKITTFSLGKRHEDGINGMEWVFCVLNPLMAPKNRTKKIGSLLL